MGNFPTIHGNSPHPLIPSLYRQLRAGRIGRREFLRTGALLGLATGGMSALIRPARAAGTPVQGGTLRYAMSVQEITDPALFSWFESANLVRHSLQYLTLTGADNITRPYLARSWEPDATLTRWRFVLRDDVTWSNGDRLTVEDVEFNLTRWTAPDSKSSNKTLFAKLERFEAVGPHEFVLHLNAPLLTIPENLYQYPTCIVHRDFGKRGENWVDNPVGTGPYSLTDYRIGSIGTLRRRENYWGKRPYLDEIRYIDLGEDVNAHIAALASDQVDLLYRVSVAHLELAGRMPGARLIEGEAAHTALFRMQVDRKPFDDIRVRRAIVKASDNGRMLGLSYRGRGEIAENHHVAPFHPDYFRLPPPVGDVAGARKLLAEAGYPDGIDLECSLGNTSGPWEQDMAQVLKQQLAAAGIRMRLNVMPSTQYWDIWDKAPFSITYWGHRPLGVMVLDLAYRSTAVWNETHYRNQEFDRVLDRAQGIVDPVARSEEVGKLERMLQEDALMIQPFWPRKFTMASNRVMNFELHPAESYDLRETWLAGS